MRTPTNYYDKNDELIYSGDAVSGLFTSSWDSEQLIECNFKIVKDYGDWWCRGIESSEYDDYLYNLHNSVTLV
jgi:hypothetical protein